MTAPAPPSQGPEEIRQLAQKIERTTSNLARMTTKEMDDGQGQALAELSGGLALLQGGNLSSLSPMKLLRNLCVAVFITIDVEQSSLLAKVLFILM